MAEEPCGVFAADGKLYVMRTGAEGERVYNGPEAPAPGGVNPDYIKTSVMIPSDGGDWLSARDRPGRWSARAATAAVTW